MALDWEQEVAQILVEAGIVEISPDEWFTFASGIRSPVYFDCRLLWSDVAARTRVLEIMVQAVATTAAGEADRVVGVATGGMPPGMILADRLGLPFAYVRPQPKDHGKKALIEGRVPTGSRAIVVEDHITTGGSLFRAMDYLTEIGCRPAVVVSIIDYGLQQTLEGMEQRGAHWIRLTSFRAVAGALLAAGRLREDGHETLMQWRQGLDQQYAH